MQREHADLIENDIAVEEVPEEEGESGGTAVNRDAGENVEESKDEVGAATTAANDSANAATRTNPVIDVTEENISEYSIEDVVMPLVGNNIRMPRNAEIAAIYHELLRKDGITMTNFA